MYDLITKAMNYYFEWSYKLKINPDMYIYDNFLLAQKDYFNICHCRIGKTVIKNKEKPVKVIIDI